MGFPSFSLKNTCTSLNIFRHISDNVYLCTSFKELHYEEKDFISNNWNAYAVKLVDSTE